MARYSKQREAILLVLQNTKSHPTAAWIYDRLREQLPNVSLGTVYRNLRKLTEEGAIISFTPDDGVERFDADTSAHHHLKCERCGCVVDLPFVPADAISERLEQMSDCKITGSELMFYGICGGCRAKV